jgi:hypothetical protein
MPQDNCDTGRRIFARKRQAEDHDQDGQAEKCDRCKGWHAKSDKPKNRRNRNPSRRPT